MARKSDRVKKKVHLDGERRARTRIPHIARRDDVHPEPEHGPVHGGNDGERAALGRLDGALKGEDEIARVERAARGLGAEALRVGEAGDCGSFVLAS